MSIGYEAKIDSHLSAEAVKQDQERFAREFFEAQRDLQSLENNMPQPNEEVAADKLMQAAKLKKVAGGYSE